MIIMGGTFPNSTDCDVPDNYGQHGLDLGQANPELAKWALFRPNVTKYQVPQEIVKTIGGGPTGGATVLAPTGGWAQRDLSVEFQRPYTPSTRTPTRSIPTLTSATPAPPPTTSAAAKSNKKAVIGGAVGGSLGGILLLSLIACFLFLCLRKRKNKLHQPPPTEADSSRSVSQLPPGGGTKSLTLTTQHTPSVSQPFTPQGSPYSRSDRTFSYQSNTVPEYPGWPTYPPSQHQLHPSPVYAPSGHSPQQFPTAAAHEMPLIRSPPGFPQQVQPQPQPMQTQMQQVIDPYYAQHPPSPPRGEQIGGRIS